MKGRLNATRPRPLILLALALTLACGVAIGLAARGIPGDSGHVEASEPSGSDGVPRNEDLSSVAFTAFATDGTALFGLNESGQYFGSEGYAVEYLAGRLDLVASYGTHGELGYARKSDFDASSFGEGANAVALYDSDGLTRIGTFFGVNADIDGDMPPGETPFVALSADDEEIFGLNERGQYFAFEGYQDLYLRGECDLEAARGEDGELGYVSTEELERAATDHRTEVPVYERDGVTEIDRLILSRE